MPRRLKLGIHVNSWQMYRVYRNQAAAAYSSLYFSFFFLANFQTITFFVTLFSRTVMPRGLKLVTYVDTGIMLLLLFVPLFFFLSNFQALNNFRHTFLRNYEA